MINRLGWIAASYATRPLVLALTGLGLLFLALGMIPAPIRSNGSTSTIPFVVLAPCVWFAIAIGCQLSSQFLGSGSRLIPRFASSHALVGVVLSASLIALGATRLVTNDGLPVPVAIAASASLVTSIIALGAATALTPAVRPPGIQRLPWMNLVLPFCVAGSLVIAARDPLASALSSPIAVIAYALAACGATALAVWTLAHLAEWSAGSSSWERILERRNPMRPDWLGVGGGSRWMFFTNRRERHIEAGLPTTPNSNWWRRVGRWRLGNPPLPFLSSGVVMLGTMGVTMLAMTRLTGAPRSNGLFPFFGILLIVMFLTQVGAKWRARLLVLPLEFLRPYSRRAMQRELAAAFALDLLPLAILFAIVATLGFHLESRIGLPWRWAPLSFLYFLALGGSGALAVGALVVLVRRPWVLLVLLLVFVLANMFGGAGLVLFQRGAPDFFSGFMTSGLNLGQFLVPILIGAIFCWVLWRRWLRIEIGQRV